MEGVDWPEQSALRVVTSGGVRLAVWELGEGPDLLLLPGLGTDHHVFVWNIGRLARNFRCLVPDQRGVGSSQASPGPYTMEMLADDASQVLDQLAPGGAHVFGASMGGMVAQQLAIRHPGQVRTLSLGCTGPGGTAAVKADPGVTKRLLGGDARDPGSAYRVACTVLYERRWRETHPEVIEDAVHWRATHPVRPGVFAAQWAASRHHHASDLLPRISAPTLILHGTADIVMPPGNALVLQSRIPGAQLRWMVGRGHLFFQEAPEETERLILEHSLAAGRAAASGRAT